MNPPCTVAPSIVPPIWLLQLAPARLRTRHAAPAPAEQAILCALAEGMLVDFDTAVLIESRYFCQSAIAFQA
jgi:3-hydroxyacyl-CoA dehydrogenase/enoyl-CoA hydratase/3-hydroxybutyryl-CoA epimerase